MTATAAPRTATQDDGSPRIVSAPAKVNLWLRVYAREDTGFHQIETLFCALQLADDIEITPAPELRLTVEGAELGAEDRNLAFRAASAFFTTAGIDERAHIRLVKRIPHGAGLGGGSSDAAATLLALNEIHGRPLDRARLLAIAEALGSDVPFFLVGAPFALAWGRGDRMIPLRPPPSQQVLIVAPTFASATAAAYAALAQRRTEEPSRPHSSFIELDSLRRWSGIEPLAHNDFEPVLFELHAALGAIKQALLEQGASIALLAGSGSAMFGVFPRASVRDRAAELVASRFPDCRIIPTATASARPKTAVFG